MQIDKDLILKLEKLAKLDLSKTEKAEIMVDLNQILHMVEKMEELDTDNVEPLVHITEATNVMREDEIKNQLTRSEALSNAPDRNDEFFKVPKVIKQ